jgi:tetratricopeptide (TPR) repeat protein
VNLNSRKAALLIACLSLPLQAVGAQTNSGSFEEQYQAAQRALADGNYPRAQSGFEQLAHADPQIAEVHANLGLIYFQEKNFSSAVTELRRALQLKPTLAGSEFFLAMSLSELGRYEQALPGLEKGFQSTLPGMKRMCGLQLERVYTALKRDSDAVRLALEMERLYPNDPEVQYHDGKIFGNYAFLTMQKLWQAPAGSIWRHQAEAEALESQGSYDAALDQYRDVLARDPKRPGIHYRIGRTLLARAQKTGSAQDVQDAAKEFTEELQLGPNPNAAYELGQIASNAGRLGDAQNYFESALKNNPDFEEAQLGLAAAMLGLQKPELAVRHLQKAISLNPENEVSWWRLAQAERALGNSAEQKKALDEFQRLHSRKSGQEEAARRLFSPDEVTQQKIEPGAPE